eukprot:GILI01009394.1.p1 GENE.GILI01009394.1~~GILI01009394.1.p1  ORF type:complete len:126 (-),score=16.55 GILI01009394.1:294-671(-)
MERRSAAPKPVAKVQNKEENEETSTEDLFSPERIMHNSRVIAFSRNFGAIVGGCCVGILGLGFAGGFLLFFAIQLVVSFGLYMKADCDSTPFFKSPSSIWTEGLTGGLMSFIMFWTLLNGIVHIY